MHGAAGAAVGGCLSARSGLRTFSGPSGTCFRTSPRATHWRNGGGRITPARSLPEGPMGGWGQGGAPASSPSWCGAQPARARTPRPGADGSAGRPKEGRKEEKTPHLPLLSPLSPGCPRCVPGAVPACQRCRQHPAEPAAMRVCGRSGCPCPRCPRPNSCTRQVLRSRCSSIWCPAAASVARKMSRPPPTRRHPATPWPGTATAWPAALARTPDQTAEARTTTPAQGRAMRRGRPWPCRRRSIGLKPSRAYLGSQGRAEGDHLARAPHRVQ